MKQCISVYKKFILIRSISFLLFFLSILIDKKFIILTFLVASLEYLLRCPKCNNIISLSKNGYTMFFVGHFCKKCGQDLKNCEVESDNVTKHRLENK